MAGGAFLKFFNAKAGVAEKEAKKRSDTGEEISDGIGGESRKRKKNEKDNVEKHSRDSGKGGGGYREQSDRAFRNLSGSQQPGSVELVVGGKKKKKKKKEKLGPTNGEADGSGRVAVHGAHDVGSHKSSLPAPRDDVRLQSKGGEKKRKNKEGSDDPGKCLESLKEGGKKKRKKDGIEAAGASEDAEEEVWARPGGINQKPGDFPFEADDADHAETPVEAYRDIAAVLGRLAEAMGKTRSTIRIYDPYFCAGGVIKRLGQYGFKRVYNRCEDFYKLIEHGKVPDYDVLLTNPPYSSDHFDKIVQFAASSGKPWMLLVPNFIYTKDYFKQHVLDKKSQSEVMYIVPRKRYTYWTPEWLHSTKYGVSTSPFPSFWFIQCLGHTGLIRSWFASRPQHETKAVQLCASVQDLPMEVRAAFDPLKKRPNPKTRKKLAKLKKAGAGVGF